MSRKFQSFLSLKYYTTMYVGGVTPWAFFPSSRDDVVEVFHILRHRLKVPFFVLGRGSNVVIQDRDFQRATVLTHYLQSLEIEKEQVIVGAGIPMSFLARKLLTEFRLSGLEFLYGLPGSIGGGALMNARVFKQELSDYIEWVEVYDTKEEKFLVIPRERCEYGYKTSLFQKRPYFIFRVALRLKPVLDILPLWEGCLKSLSMRLAKHQFTYPSSGSFFKNDVSLGKPSGFLLESLNLKELQVGGAKISEYHANFFVNPEGKATFQDICELKKLVDEKTKEHGFLLEPEVHLID